jgi:hypothetical protein
MFNSFGCCVALRYGALNNGGKQLAFIFEPDVFDFDVFDLMKVERTAAQIGCTCEFSLRSYARPPETFRITVLDKVSKMSRRKPAVAIEVAAKVG